MYNKSREGVSVMKKRYKVLIYLFCLILIILSTFSATWILLEKTIGDTDI